MRLKFFLIVVLVIAKMLSKWMKSHNHLFFFFEMKKKKWLVVGVRINCYSLSNWGFLFHIELMFFLFFIFDWAGESECCYNSNVAPIWVEFIYCWIGPIIFLLGIRIKSIAWGVACKDFWWKVSFWWPKLFIICFNFTRLCLNCSQIWLTLIKRAFIR